MKSVLLVCSEIFPLLKTGGLADFAFSYSRALQEVANTIVMVPGFQDLLDKLESTEVVAEFTLDGYPTRVLQSRVPISGVTLWVVDVPGLLGRSGNPYTNDQGHEHGDNPERFNHFCKVVTEAAMDRLGLNWRPQIVHCNDWHTGLIPAYLSQQADRPATVFSIHNLAYQGNYPAEFFERLNIPWHWRDYEHLEFHQQLSFIKGGLVFADMLSTVSPGYAQDIQTDQFGCGLQGLLSYRRDRLVGILNGVDYQVWNPKTDSYLVRQYDVEHLQHKHTNKLALQRQFGLAEGNGWFAIGFIGRLVNQKGIELLLQAMHATIDQNIQWLIVGKGDASYEVQLQALADNYPDRIHVFLGYDEALSHQVEAAADAFLMPSHYEPCGLNQLYSLKYGTPPLVSATGGLRDSVAHADPDSLQAGKATGFLFPPGDSTAMLQVIAQAHSYFNDKPIWQSLQRQGMAQDFGWQNSVQRYLNTYDLALHWRDINLGIIDAYTLQPDQRIG